MISACLLLNYLVLPRRPKDYSLGLKYHKKRSLDLKKFLYRVLQESPAELKAVLRDANKDNFNNGNLEKISTVS